MTHDEDPVRGMSRLCRSLRFPLTESGPDLEAAAETASVQIMAAQSQMRSAFNRARRSGNPYDVAVALGALVQGMRLARNSSLTLIACATRAALAPEPDLISCRPPACSPTGPTADGSLRPSAGDGLATMA